MALLQHASQLVRPFARFLAVQDIPEPTFDCRGAGGSRPASLKGFKAPMRDWGEIDILGVLAWVHRQSPGHRILWVGHSYGGFGTGLAHNNTLVDRQLSVATMSGHWQVTIAEAGVKRIGHLGSFHAEHRATLRPKARPGCWETRSIA